MATRPARDPYPESYVPSDKGSKEWHEYTKVQELVSANDPDFDIVFVHGLGSRWQQTWCGSDGSSWLEDLLPGELPTARILVAGFNVLDRIDSTLSSFADGCEKFMEDLKETRKHEKRPIVFVAHSFGALIVQQALFKHSYPALSHAIRGLIFFGAPCFGPDHDSWKKFWHQLGKMIYGDRPSMKEASITRLGKVNTDFSNWLSSEPFSHHFYRFYEGLPVYRIGFVVEKSKCADHQADDVAISSDHLGIAKFDDPSDPAYQMVLKKLKILKSYRDTSASSSFMTQSTATTFSAPTRAATAESQISCSDSREYILNSDNVNAKLALALDDQGQYEAAEGLYKEAIEQFTEHYGETDKRTLFCKDKIAVILRDKSSYEEAAKISKEVLMARIELQGLENPATLSSAANLALIMRYQSKQQEAFSILRNALDNNEKRPLDSITRTRIVSVLAKIYRDHGAYDAAVLFSRDVVRASMWWLGEYDPFTLNRQSDLTVAYSTSGFHNSFLVAEDLGRSTLDALEKNLGRDHPNALRASRRLGNYQRFQGDVEGSFKRLENTWIRQKERLGSTHPACLTTMTSLASASVLKGYVGDARQALEEALEEQTQILGSNHPNALWTTDALKLLEGLKIDNRKSRMDINPDVAEFFKSPSRIQHKVSLEPVPVFWATDKPEESELINAVLGDSLHDLETVLDIVTDEPLLGRALRVASYLGKDKMVQLLLERGAPVNARGGYYGTPISAAAAAGHFSTVQFLLEMNADVNVQAGLLNTALRAAVFKGHTDIIDLLLNSGADPMLHAESITILQVAVSRGDTVTIRKLLDRKADVNASDPLFGTPLQEAAFLGHLNVVALLIENGADPNLPGGLYGSAMQAALRASHRDVVKYLMSHGADSSSYNMLNAIIDSGMDLVDVSFGRHTSDLFMMEPQFAPTANVNKLSFCIRKHSTHKETVEVVRKEEYTARAKTPPRSKSPKAGTKENPRERSKTRKLSKHLKILSR